MRPSLSAAPGVPPPSSGSEDARPVILLADDDLQIRKVLRLILEHAGYRVLAASDGVEALAISRGFSGAIHLLLTDVEMPNMNGPALWGWISKERPETKVLLMSGRSSVRGLPFLRKPLTPAGLKQAILKLMPPAQLPG